jgi:hypothetical protein
MYAGMVYARSTAVAYPVRAISRVLEHPACWIQMLHDWCDHHVPPIGTHGNDDDDLCTYMLSQTLLQTLRSLVQFSLLAWPLRLHGLVL